MNIISETIDYGEAVGWVVIMLFFASILFWMGYLSYKDIKNSDKRMYYYKDKGKEKNKNTSEKMMVFIAVVGILLSFTVIYKYTIYAPATIIKAEITDVNEVYDNGYEIVRRDGDLFILRKSK